MTALIGMGLHEPEATRWLVGDMGVPGHDAWIIGDELCVVVERQGFAGARP